MLKIGITQGDANGVGPEVIIKALSPEGMTEMMTPVIFANKSVILATMQRLRGENFRFQAVSSASDAKEGKINLVNTGSQQLKPIYGEPTKESGLSAYEALEAAVEALVNGDIDALVTAPICKSTINSEDFHFPGHTEYLEDRLVDKDDSSQEDIPDPEEDVDSEEPAEQIETSESVEESGPDGESQSAEDSGDAEGPESSETAGSDDDPFGELPAKAQMILFNDDLRVALLTTHLPLSEVSGSVTQANIIRSVRRFENTLRKDFRCDRPRIAVLSLNPHSGDNGLLGSEEKDEILPALTKLRAKGILAFGPYPADGFFGNGEWRKFDGVLAMYHDQGLAPFKTIAGQAGVNFTSGLDYVRTSPDHGTAFDIADEMKADPTSMRNAIFRAIDILKARKRYEEMTRNPLKIKPVKSQKAE